MIYETKSTFINHYKGGSIRFPEMTQKEKRVIIPEEHKGHLVLSISCKFILCNKAAAMNIINVIAL